MKLIIALILVTGIIVNGRITRPRRNTVTEFKICVAESLMSLCNEMAAQETKSTAKISCISGRDRIKCIDQIKERQADFTIVDPEDMYVAANVPNQDFTIFEEIRTLEEPDAEFRYQGVAVVHKNLQIDDITKIKGLKSCHTGVGRNVGYKIPLTKLKNLGIIGNLNEPDLSARENELKALSNLFSQACIVGEWSPDPSINKNLKEKYPNLCQLCEDPKKCDYPDKFSGYDGALRCVAHNGGDIAWTKVIFVKKFFGLPVGTVAAQPSDENPDDFAYLCPDGSKVPITDPPCSWAARPWQGYMTNTVVLKSVNELRKKILNLYTVGFKNHAVWLDKVLELNNKTVPKENKVIGPGDYLDKANYTDVVERDYGPPFKTIRFCVTSDDELEKCRHLSRSAFSRDIRPRFDCVEEKTIDDCLTTIRDNGADIIALEGGLVDEACTNYNLKPIVSEVYGSSEGSYEVAIVRKDSKYTSFAELKGRKACFSGIGRAVALYTLSNLNLIKSKNCPHYKALAEYFSGGTCLFGSKSLADNNIEESTAKLCGQVDSNQTYFENTDALRCLVEGNGDVAFLKHLTLTENSDGKNSQPWASNLKSEEYELLCLNGKRAPIDQYKNCNLVQIPPNKVVASNSKTNAEIDEISNALLSISNLYGKRPELFKLFGSYNNKNDLLFKDSTTGLEIIRDDNNPIHESYATMLQYIDICEHGMSSAVGINAFGFRPDASSRFWIISILFLILNLYVGNALIKI